MDIKTLMALLVSGRKRVQILQLFCDQRHRLGVVRFGLRCGGVARGFFMAVL